MDTIHALIIDDNPDNLEVLAEMLDELSITHTTVQDPAALAETLAHLPQVDLVFLDLELPGIDGYAVLDKLKNDFRLAARVIAYTVHESEASNARRIGFDGFLAKPLNVSRFPAQIKRILNGESVWDTR